MTKDGFRVKFRYSDMTGTIIDDDPGTNPMGETIWTVKWDDGQIAVNTDDELEVIE